MAEIAGGVAKLDAKSSFEDVEEVVGFRVGVPDEFAFDLDDHDIVAVEGCDDFRGPLFGEFFEFGLEVDRGCGGFHS